MAQGYPVFSVGTAWTDLAAQPGYTGLASALTLLQNLSPGILRVYYSSSGTAPATINDGLVLSEFQTIQGTAAHIWVRATAGAASLFAMIAG